MESSSSGRFHHYELPKKSSPAEGASSGGSKGQDANIDICKVPLPNVRLEEVGRSEYFLARKTIPPAGTPVQVRNELVGGRIAAEATRGKQTIGFLPTQFNYLLGCLKEGHKYKGTVTASGDSPIPRVVIDLFPS